MFEEIIIFHGNNEVVVSPLKQITNSLDDLGSTVKDKKYSSSK